MSDADIRDKMIDFIKGKERDIVAEKMTGDSHTRNEVVKAILNELEKEVPDEN